MGARGARPGPGPDLRRRRQREFAEGRRALRVRARRRVAVAFAARGRALSTRSSSRCCRPISRTSPNNPICGDRSCPPGLGSALPSQAMPIYEFECEECGARFEELVAADADARRLPECGAATPRRLISPVSPPGRPAARGARCALGRIAPARARSGAQRADRRGAQRPQGERIVSATRRAAPRAAGRALQRGLGLHQVPPARDPHQGRLRRRQRRRRADVRRRGARRRRGPPGAALRRPRRQLLNELLEEIGLLARRRLHRQRAQVAARPATATRSRSRSRPASPTCSSRCG